MKSKIPVSLAKPASQHPLGIVVTLLVLSLLVGSLLVVLNLAHQHHPATAHPSLSQAPTATSQIGVYVGSADGAIYRLNAANGQLVWRYQTRGNSIPAPA